jgi:efflux transporter, outer membrane factor (OMF) lipoprotein, NodT family
MRRAVALLTLLATGCVSLEPKLAAPDPAIPPSWPVGDAYLVRFEAALPAVTYRDIFRDPRLQTLIAQALVNNRDLMIAAANIDAAREQYVIQRAQQFPQLDANAGVTLTGNRSNGSSNNGSSNNGSGSGSGSSSKGVTASHTAGLSVPSFELDLFGRLRSLTHAQLEQYLATEAGARATRLTLVANVANAWLDYASDTSLLLIAEQTASAAQKSVRLTRLRLEGESLRAPTLSQAEQILDQAEADLAQQKTAVAQDVNALRLLVGTQVDANLLPASIDEAGATVGELPAGINSYVLLRRPDVVQAEYQLRAANADIGAARAALFPRISLTGLLGFASSALTGLFTGGAFGGQASANAAYTIFQAGAGHANVRLTEAERNAALATYQRAIQTAFREVSDALARRGTMDQQLAATQQRQAAAADVASSRSALPRGHRQLPQFPRCPALYYAVQQVLVQTKLTAAQNRVALYSSLGGDALLQTAPVCDVVYVSNASNAKLASQCSPM